MAKTAPPPLDTDTWPTRSENWQLLAGGVLMMLGVFADGWAHTNIIDELESFFTPWHAIIFAGFLAALAVVVRAMLRRLPSTGSWRAAVPQGWNQAAVGVGLFGLFFVGDGIWHTAFGIEADLEALLSPTHLMGLVGALAIFSSPLAVEWRRHPGRTGSLRQLAPVLTAATLITFGAAFFLMWAWFANLGFPAEQFETFTRRAGDFAVISARSWGLLSYLVTAAWMVAMPLLLARRWDLPVGATTIVVAVPSVMLLAIQSFGGWQRIFSVLVGLLIVEWFVARFRPGPSRRGAARTFGFLIPTLIFSLDMVTIAIWLDLSWEPEFVAGSVTFAGLFGLALAFLVFPPETLEA